METKKNIECAAVVNEDPPVQMLAHSNEIEEIISSRLPPVVRWGTVYLLVLLSALVTACWFIRYPEIIKTKAIILKAGGNPVRPVNSRYYAELFISQAGLNKVKTGQQVRLKLSVYPFQEYGSIKGEITFISSVGTEHGYLAKVLLPDGLRTSFKKQLQFRDGLTAQVEIVINNARLLEKILKH